MGIVLTNGLHLLCPKCPTLNVLMVPCLLQLIGLELHLHYEQTICTKTQDRTHHCLVADGLPVKQSYLCVSLYVHRHWPSLQPLHLDLPPHPTHLIQSDNRWRGATVCPVENTQSQVSSHRHEDN